MMGPIFSNTFRQNQIKVCRAKSALLLQCKYGVNPVKFMEWLQIYISVTESMM